ncbi:hypothetical protein EDB19DRAFT_2024104 [Suillus lakei]|nr:hypothetical protein EDB19DRAFT_2024104 [Suillus lakei]
MRCGYKRILASGSPLTRDHDCRSRLVCCTFTILSPMDAMTTRFVTLDSLQAQQVVFVAIASFTVLCWDHIITFADEVALIWCKRKGPLGYLFLLNRYITPLGIRRQYRRNFVRYEMAMATIGIGIAQLMMMLRIYVLHRGHRLAIAIPGLLFVVWVALEAYVMARGEMVPLVQQMHSCREVYDLPPYDFSSRWLTLFAARAWMPLTYDSAIFAMTLWHTLPIVRNKGAGRILLTFLLDGTLYYAVICSANLALTVTIVRAPPGQKGVAVQLTVVMTSRVTLNLKKQAETPVLNVATLSRAHYFPRSTPNASMVAVTD